MLHATQTSGFLQLDQIAISGQWEFFGKFDLAIYLDERQYLM